MNLKADMRYVVVHGGNGIKQMGQINDGRLI